MSRVGEPRLAAHADSQAQAARVYAGYLWVQAALGIVLWVGIATSETVRSWFELAPDERAVTDAFVFGDLGVIVASAFAAWGVRTRAPWSVPMVAFTAGGVIYPTLYLMVWVALTGEGLVALAVMVPVSTLTCWIAYQVYLSRR